MLQLGHILDQRYKETKKPNDTSEESGAKAGSTHAPCIHHP